MITIMMLVRVMLLEIVTEVAMVALMPGNKKTTDTALAALLQIVFCSF